ncbi:MAG: DUF3418 domain-containing protein, partial [Acidimicrobiales bacterium]
LIDEAGGPAWTGEEFDRLVEHVRDGMSDALRDAWTGATTVLERHQRIAATLDGLTGRGFVEAVDDVRSQLRRLVYPGMCTAVGIDQLAHVARYLRAIERRLDTLADDPQRDRRRMTICRRLEADYEAVRERVPWSPELEEVGWLLEEMRVATFAQPLGTAQPVSEKRIWTAMAALERS